MSDAHGRERLTGVERPSTALSKTYSLPASWASTSCGIMETEMTPLPTVLVPGLFTTPRLFFGQLPALWRFGPVMVADHARDDTVDGAAARLLADAPPRFALAGLSYGGVVAQAVVRAAPERVDRLALLSTTARPDPPEAAELRQAMLAQLRAGRLDELIDASIAGVVAPSRAQDAELRTSMKDMLRTIGAEAAIRQVHAHMGRPDARAALGAMAVPTLVVVGDADRLAPPEHARELAGAIPDSELVVLEDCGHLSALERPDAVTDALVAWRAR